MKKITLDDFSSLRWPSLVLPVIFGSGLFWLPKGIFWNIASGLTILSVLVVMLRLTTTFDLDSKTITWKYGLIFPMISYRKKRFNEVTLILKTKRTEGSVEYYPGTGQHQYQSNTFYKIYLGIKKRKKKIRVFISSNEQKVDRYCEHIAAILSFSENPRAGVDKRLWNRKKQPQEKINKTEKNA